MLDTLSVRLKDLYLYSLNLMTLKPVKLILFLVVFNYVYFYFYTGACES